MNSVNSTFEESESKKGFRVYKIRGVDKTIVARKGGPTKDQVKTSPNYAQLRKNQQEFGLASAVSKQIRLSFSEQLNSICESYLSGKLTAKLRTLMQQQSGQIGQRAFLPSIDGALLKGFNFNAASKFHEIFKGKFLVRQGQQRGHLIFHFPSFVPEQELAPAAKATHFKLFTHLVSVSDFIFDKDTLQYNAIDLHNHGLYQTEESPMSPILRIPLEPMTFHISLVPEQQFEKGCALVLLVGIKFYSLTKKGYSFVENGNAMMIYDTF